MGRKSGLVLDARSPLKGFELAVTPGLIVGTVTVVCLLGMHKFHSLF
jgi:hypothetical protein